jgi:hypothetical protein
MTIINENTFLKNEIDVDMKIESILRNIEAKILKDAMDPFAQKEIRELQIFIDKTEALRNIYTKEQNEIITNRPELLREGATDQALTAILTDLIKIIKDLEEYAGMLNAMKRDIIHTNMTLKDAKDQILEISDGMKVAYSDYIQKNEQTIKLLAQIRSNIRAIA